MADPITSAISAISFELGNAGFFVAEEFLAVHAAAIANTILAVTPAILLVESQRQAVAPVPQGCLR